MAWVPIMDGLTVFSVHFYHTEEWTERSQQLLEAATSGNGSWRVISINMSPRPLGDTPHLRD